MKFEVIRSNRKSMTIEIDANKLIIRAPISNWTFGYDPVRM